ncbi:LD-carboxypeptidase [Candidatus Pacearchaeota archaeon CG10_big_fil_rev_8_21_14_0_10_34_76]|nr:MAG: LD-carboxypeptidase [Candidatus Pacearchaeota archaeon CG10_big_fil_rev_8_21_14_0_10_34_76]
MVIPDKLRVGDEIRVVAPARSLALPWISKELQNIAKSRFQELGLKLTFSKNVMEINEFNSSSVQSRVEDLHEAFRDKNVRAIISVIGGYNSIEILPFLDYDLIKNNPKILSGYSDITALQNAIYAKTGLMTYSGPHYFDFGDLKGFDYTLDYFKKCLMQEDAYEIKPSEKWSNDKWGKDQDNRKFYDNEGYAVINEGTCSGKIIGGNLCTLRLLQGTEFWPDLTNSILFIEDDSESHLDMFNRDLYSLSLNTQFKGVKGIIIGRFQPDSEVSLDSIKTIVGGNKALSRIPIVANADFGHTSPKITFPIGGEVRIIANVDSTKIEILKH